MGNSVAILGASRGLGLAIAKEILLNTDSQLWLSSRKVINLNNYPLFKNSFHRVLLFPMDFTLPNAHDEIITSLKEFNPQRLIYCAGGGPYGEFKAKPWHSHLWTFKLNLLFPAQLTHTLLAEKTESFKDLTQIIFIGSAIAEDKADPGAVSYASSKHGLKGLVRTLIEEVEHTSTNNQNSPKVDLRLYSPHYMNTELLPKNSKPRQNPLLIDEPEVVARDILNWANSPTTKEMKIRITKRSIES